MSKTNNIIQFRHEFHPCVWGTPTLNGKVGQACVNYSRRPGRQEGWGDAKGSAGNLNLPPKAERPTLVKLLPPHDGYFLL